MYNILSRSITKSKCSIANLSKMYKKMSKGPESPILLKRSISEPINPIMKSIHDKNTDLTKLPTSNNSSKLLTKKYGYQIMKRSLFSDTPKEIIQIMMFSTSSSKYFYTSTINKDKRRSGKSSNTKSVDVYKKALEDVMKIKFQKKRIEQPLMNADYKTKPYVSSENSEPIEKSLAKVHDMDTPSRSRNPRIRLVNKWEEHKKEREVEYSKPNKNIFEIVYPKYELTDKTRIRDSVKQEVAYQLKPTKEGTKIRESNKKTEFVDENEIADKEEKEEEDEEQDEVALSKFQNLLFRPRIDKFRKASKISGIIKNNMEGKHLAREKYALLLMKQREKLENSKLDEKLPNVIDNEKQAMDEDHKNEDLLAEEDPVEFQKTSQKSRIHDECIQESKQNQEEKNINYPKSENIEKPELKKRLLAIPIYFFKRENRVNQNNTDLKLDLDVSNNKEDFQDKLKNTQESPKKAVTNNLKQTKFTKSYRNEVAKPVTLCSKKPRRKIVVVPIKKAIRPVKKDFRKILSQYTTTTKSINPEKLTAKGYIQIIKEAGENQIKNIDNIKNQIAENLNQLKNNPTEYLKSKVSKNSSEQVLTKDDTKKPFEISPEQKKPLIEQMKDSLKTSIESDFQKTFGDSFRHKDVKAQNRKPKDQKNPIKSSKFKDDGKLYQQKEDKEIDFKTDKDENKNSQLDVYLMQVGKDVKAPVNTLDPNKKKTKLNLKEEQNEIVSNEEKSDIKTAALHQEKIKSELLPKKSWILSKKNFSKEVISKNSAKNNENEISNIDSENNTNNKNISQTLFKNMSKITRLIRQDFDQTEKDKIHHLKDEKSPILQETNQQKTSLFSGEQSKLKENVLNDNIEESKPVLKNEEQMRDKNAGETAPINQVRSEDNNIQINEDSSVIGKKQDRFDQPHITPPPINIPTPKKKKDKNKKKDSPPSTRGNMILPPRNVSENPKLNKEKFDIIEKNLKRNKVEDLFTELPKKDEIDPNLKKSYNQEDNEKLRNNLMLLMELLEKLDLKSRENLTQKTVNIQEKSVQEPNFPDYKLSSSHLAKNVTTDRRKENFIKEDAKPKLKQNHSESSLMYFYLLDEDLRPEEKQTFEDLNLNKPEKINNKLNLTDEPSLPQLISDPIDTNKKLILHEDIRKNTDLLFDTVENTKISETSETSKILKIKKESKFSQSKNKISDGDKKKKDSNIPSEFLNQNKRKDCKGKDIPLHKLSMKEIRNVIKNVKVVEEKMEPSSKIVEDKKKSRESSLNLFEIPQLNNSSGKVVKNGELKKNHNEKKEKPKSISDKKDKIKNTILSEGKDKLNLGKIDDPKYLHSYSVDKIGKTDLTKILTKAKKICVKEEYKGNYNIDSLGKTEKLFVDPYNNTVKIIFGGDYLKAPKRNSALIERFKQEENVLKENLKEQLKKIASIKGLTEQISQTVRMIKLSNNNNLQSKTMFPTVQNCTEKTFSTSSSQFESNRKKPLYQEYFFTVIHPQKDGNVSFNSTLSSDKDNNNNITNIKNNKEKDKNKKKECTNINKNIKKAPITVKRNLKKTPIITISFSKKQIPEKKNSKENKIKKLVYQVTKKSRTKKTVGKENKKNRKRRRNVILFLLKDELKKRGAWHNQILHQTMSPKEKVDQAINKYKFRTPTEVSNDFNIIPSADLERNQRKRTKEKLSDKFHKNLSKTLFKSKTVSKSKSGNKQTGKDKNNPLNSKSMLAKSKKDNKSIFKSKSMFGRLEKITLNPLTVTPHNKKQLLESQLPRKIMVPINKRLTASEYFISKKKSPIKSYPKSETLFTDRKLLKKQEKIARSTRNYSKLSYSDNKIKSNENISYYDLRPYLIPPFRTLLLDTDKTSPKKKCKRLAKDEILIEDEKKGIGAVQEILPVANSAPAIKKLINDGVQKIMEKRSINDKRPRPFNIMATIIDLIHQHSKVNIQKNEPTKENHNNEKKVLRPTITIEKNLENYSSLQKRKNVKNPTKSFPQIKCHKLRDEDTTLTKKTREKFLIPPKINNKKYLPLKIIYCNVNACKSNNESFLSNNEANKKVIKNERSLASIKFEFLKRLKDEFDYFDSKNKSKEKNSEENSNRSVISDKEKHLESKKNKSILNTILQNWLEKRNNNNYDNKKDPKEK